jgi:predicted  nucleic acid-binding Zn-ribbon protein
MAEGFWPLLLLSLFSLVAVAVLAVVVQRGRPCQLRLERKLAEQAREISTLRDDLGALCSGAVGVSERVARLEQRLRRIRERQEQLELAGSEPQPYEQAIDLALRGASVEEVATRCGISRGEAELVVMMNRMERGVAD